MCIASGSAPVPLVLIAAPVGPPVDKPSSEAPVKSSEPCTVPFRLLPTS